MKIVVGIGEAVLLQVFQEGLLIGVYSARVLN